MRIGRVVGLAAVVILGTSTVAPAQTLSGDVLQDWQGLKQIMMSIADAMPEDAFDYASNPPSAPSASRSSMWPGAT